MHAITKTRVQVAFGAVALGALTVVPAIPASSQQNPVTVTGQAVCGTAGPVGRYRIDWTVTNSLQGQQVPKNLPLGGAVIDDVMVASATETGAWTGTVTIDPNPIPAQSSGTGSDGPVPGNTTGVVTLTVVWSYFDGETTVNGQSTGTATLAGDCVIPTSTTTSTSTSTTSTTVVVNNTTVTAAFTG
ncbi:MAG: hypothetical protein U0Q07_05860 [Acidimicrobiales bacterium]